MAEARLHFLFETLSNAEAQYSEQKYHCMASLEALVKLLPGSNKAFSLQKRQARKAATSYDFRSEISKGKRRGVIAQDFLGVRDKLGAEVQDFQREENKVEGAAVQDFPKEVEKANRGTQAVQDFPSKEDIVEATTLQDWRRDDEKVDTVTQSVQDFPREEDKQKAAVEEDKQKAAVEEDKQKAVEEDKQKAAVEEEDLPKVPAVDEGNEGEDNEMKMEVNAGTAKEEQTTAEDHLWKEDEVEKPGVDYILETEDEDPDAVANFEATEAESHKEDFLESPHALHQLSFPEVGRASVSNLAATVKGNEATADFPTEGETMDTAVRGCPMEEEKLASRQKAPAVDEGNEELSFPKTGDTAISNLVATGGKAGTARKEVKFQTTGEEEDEVEEPVLDYMSGTEDEKEAPLGNFETTQTKEESPHVRDQLSFPKTGGAGVSNLVATMKSFLPLVVQQPVMQIANGKRDVKVKALEAAEAARKLEEKRIEERKRKMETLKREKFTNRLEQEKLKKMEKMEEEQRKKDEERKKKETDVRKRKKEELDRKERDEKRRKVDDVLRSRKEQEEKMRADLDEKENRRKAMIEAEREKKALDEEIKRQKRLEKEKEAERRRKAEEDAKAAWLANKEADRKRREETFHRMKMLEKEQRMHTEKELSIDILPPSLRLPNKPVRSMGFEGGGEKSLGTPALRSCGGFAVKSCGGFRKPFLPTIDLEEDGPLSYEISPYRDDDNDSDDSESKRAKIKKPIPRWASKENVTAQLMHQAHIDPDEIFSGDRSCSLKEVFGTTGNARRRDFSQRGNSGDWLGDMVTWKEELQYKKSMGYLQI